MDRFVVSEAESGSAFTLVISGIANQNSVRDAGNFEITTYNEINGQFYIVDSQFTASSYVA
jgi:hypothetical protein